MLKLRTIYIACLLAVIVSLSCKLPEQQQACGTAELPADTFSFYYNYAGLGSGYYNWCPVFRVRGTEYLYTKEQHSVYFEPDPHVDTICKGYLRQTSIDSIIALVRPVEDTVIYETNPDIMSGGIHGINIRTKSGIDLTFDLHNASHPLAEKIIDIINTNIPAGKDRLWLFEH